MITILISIFAMLQTLISIRLMVKLRGKAARKIRRIVLVYYKKELAGVAVNMLAASQLISRLSVENSDDGSNDVKMVWTDLVHPIYLR